SRRLHLRPRRCAMPWEVSAVSELRLTFVHHVLTLRRPVAAACRDFGISRTTAYKWLGRYRGDPAAALAHRSRRPHQPPRQTPDDVQAAILQARDRFGWGPRKIHAHLTAAGAALPSARTVANVLRRCGRVGATPAPAEAPLRFERAAPNE